MLLVISVTEELGIIRCQAGPGVVVHPNLHRMLQGDCSNRITFEQRPERRLGKEPCEHLTGVREVTCSASVAGTKPP